MFSVFDPALCCIRLFKEFAIQNLFVPRILASHRQKYNNFFSAFIENINEDDIQYVVDHFPYVYLQSIVENFDTLNKDKIMKSIQSIEKKSTNRLISACFAKEFDSCFDVFSKQNICEDFGNVHITWEDHESCKDYCPKNPRCPSMIASRYINMHRRTRTQKKFSALVAAINQLLNRRGTRLLLSDRIVGLLGDIIVIQNNLNKYTLISYDTTKDQVIFWAGEEISTEEIEKIKSNDTLWY